MFLEDKIKVKYREKKLASWSFVEYQVEYTKERVIVDINLF